MLGQGLRIKRVEILKESLKDISEKTGFSIVYLSEVERGEKVPKHGKALKKLAKGYGISFNVVLDALKQDLRIEAGERL